MKMIAFYKDILTMAGLEVTNDGYIKIQTTGKSLQVTVDSLPLVLPTKEQLDTTMASDGKGNLTKIKTVFHPLRENIIRSESAVLAKLREAISGRFNYVLFRVISVLLEVCRDPKLQKKPNREMVRLLSPLSDVTTAGKSLTVDEKSISLLEKLIEVGGRTNGLKNTIGFYIRRGGNIGEERFNRMAVVVFPLYEELLESDGKTVRGITLRIKDKGVFTKMYEYIFSDMGSAESYMFGCNDATSPGLVSLLEASYTIATALNTVIENFRKFFDDADSLITDLDWVDYVEDVETRNRELVSIPMFNPGEANSDPTAKAVRSPGTVGGSVPISAPQLTPGVVVPHSGPVSTGNGLDPRSLVSTNAFQPQGNYGGNIINNPNQLMPQVQPFNPAQRISSAQQQCNPQQQGFNNPQQQGFNNPQQGYNDVPWNTGGTIRTF